MKVSIQGNAYDFTMGWGALYLFEESCPEPFDARKHRHLHLMYECILMNANEGFPLDHAGLVRALDSEPGLAARLDAAFVQAFGAWAGADRGDEPAGGGAQKKS